MHLLAVQASEQGITVLHSGCEHLLLVWQFLLLRFGIHVLWCIQCAVLKSSCGLNFHHYEIIPLFSSGTSCVMIYFVWYQSG